MFSHAFSRSDQNLFFEFVGSLPLPQNAFLDGGPLNDITKISYLRPCTPFTDTIIFHDNFEVWPDLIKVKSKSFDKITTKLIKSILSPNDYISPHQIAWHQNLPLNFPWTKIYKNIFKNPCPQIWNETYYLLLQRGLPNGDRAYRHDLPYPPNYYCPNCPNSLETIEHIFVNCNIARGLWNWMKRTWKNTTGTAPPITLFYILSGGSLRFSKSLSQDHLKEIYIIFHRATIHTLWRIRCEIHHGNQVSLTGALKILIDSIKRSIFNLFNTYKYKYLILLAERFSSLITIQNDNIKFNF